jgi:hypothetical protein
MERPRFTRHSSEASLVRWRPSSPGPPRYRNRNGRRRLSAMPSVHGTVHVAGHFERSSLRRSPNEDDVDYASRGSDRGPIHSCVGTDLRESGAQRTRQLSKPVGSLCVPDELARTMAIDQRRRRAVGSKPPIVLPTAVRRFLARAATKRSRYNLGSFDVTQTAGGNASGLSLWRHMTSADKRRFSCFKVPAPAFRIIGSTARI